MFKKQQSAVRTKQTKRKRIIDPRHQMILKQVLIGGGICLFIGLILTGVWYGTRIDSLTLKTVTAEGGETIPHALVTQKVEEQLNGYYLGIVPKRFAWTYPDEAVMRAVETVPRIKDPVINRESGMELSVQFSEYEPFALWCAEDLSGCFLVDNHGYAFAPAPQLKGGAFMRYITLGRTPVLGATIVNAEQLTNMNEFVDRVSRELPFAISTVEIDAVSDVFYIIGGGGEIKATLTMSAEEVFTNLLAVLSAPEFKTLAPGNFQYIDLRFGSKVFVNDTPPGMGTTTDSVASSTESEVSSASVSSSTTEVAE